MKHLQRHHEQVHTAGATCTCGHVHKTQHNDCRESADTAQAAPQSSEGCGCGQDHAEGIDSGDELPRSTALPHRAANQPEASCSCAADHGSAEDGCGCGHEHGVTESGELRRNGIRLGIAATLFLAGLLVPESLVKTLLFAASYILAGYPVLLSAGKNILGRKMFDETLLMSIATVGAAALGEFSEAAAVMILFGVGEMLQDLAVGKTRNSISALLELRPDTANLLVDGQIQVVDPARVAVGQWIVIRPFERIPLDGKVVEGESFVDESALTGESVPVRASAGRDLLAGAINGDGALTLEVERVYAESAVSKIIEMTEQAALQKSPKEKFITRFARVYTPIVVAVAALLAVVPPLLGFGTFGEWIYTALTLLVISCPCALVISVPLAFFAGLGGASRAGILVRGSTTIEALAKTKTVAMDKTGTLTRGEFAVVGIHPEALAGAELLEVCAHAESLSTHPIAKALVARYGGNIDAARVTEFAEVRGRGVVAKVDGVSLLAGNRDMMRENHVAVTGSDAAGTVVYVAYDGRYAGSISLGDSLKEDAADTIERLGQMDIRTVMLTGDNAETAGAVAAALNLAEYHAKLLPGDKVEHILRLKEETEGTTVFIGDGINDSPVIAAADVGVSMGGLGSDAAIQASDVVLMTDEPKKILTAIKSSKRTLRIVNQNIVLALGIKGAIILLGLFGISSMWLAIVADVGVALLAVANSVRALRFRGE